MSHKRLKTAIMGLNGIGGLLLEAARQVDCLEISAVADQETQLAEDAAARCNCRCYDDYRQLITQGRYDCLLVAESPHRCDHYVREALKAKCNVFKLAPPARSLEEAAELVGLAHACGTGFVVGNVGRVSDGFAELKKYISQGQMEHVFLVTAVCRASAASLCDWRTDPKLAGGGVLLYDCYELIDQIVWNFGMPELVYTLTTNAAGDRQQRQYLTEDTAVMTMRFAESLIGNLTVSRHIEVERGGQSLRVHTRDKIIMSGRDRFVVADHDGGIEVDRKCEPNERDGVKKLIENFAMNVISPDKNKLFYDAATSLQNMAVIEAAYLSARTAMPEEPARVLEIAKLEPATVQIDPE